MRRKLHNPILSGVLAGYIIGVAAIAVPPVALADESEIRSAESLARRYADIFVATNRQKAERQFQQAEVKALAARGDVTGNSNSFASLPPELSARFTRLTDDGLSRVTQELQAEVAAQSSATDSQMVLLIDAKRDALSLAMDRGSWQPVLDAASHWPLWLFTLLCFWCVVALDGRTWLRKHVRSLRSARSQLMTAAACGMVLLSVLGLWAADLLGIDSTAASAAADLRLDVQRTADGPSPQALLQTSRRNEESLPNSERIHLAAQELWVQHVLQREIAKELDRTRTVLSPNPWPSIFVWLATAGYWGVFVTCLIVYKRRVFWRCAKCDHVGAQSIKPDSEGEEYECHMIWDRHQDGEDRPEGSRSGQHDPATSPRSPTNGQCSFVLDRDSMRAAKLYFPIVGNPQVGKSVWLTALDQSVEWKLFSPSLVISRVKTGEHVFDVLTDILKTILRLGPENVTPTQKRLPAPAIYQMSDGDALRHSNVLVNIADFPGEAMQSLPRNHPLRRRMFRSHGVLMFVDLEDFRHGAGLDEAADGDFDPDSGAGQDARSQIQAVQEFISEFNRRKSGAPVAVCVSKIDTLPTGALAAGYETQIRDYYERLHTIERNRSVGRTSLHLIEQRHQATLELTQKMFGDLLPGELGRLDTPLCRLFPITSYGFNRPAGPGPIKPWGELEPLLWLLHMNGLSVFQ